MSYGSSAPAAKAAIVTVLQARDGLAGVKVEREYPADPNKVGEVIFVGREGGQQVTSTSVVPVFLGTPVIFDESYTLWVTVQVLHDKSSGTQESTTERAWTLAAEIIGAVAADPRLGVTDDADLSTFHIGRDGDPYEYDETGGFLGSGGYGTRVVLGLHCSARISLS